MDWNVTGGINIHDSAAFGLKPEALIVADMDDFTLGALVSDRHGALDFRYDYSGADSFRVAAGTSLNCCYRDGGLWTLYADLGQDLRFWNRMALRYRAGIQFGLSWSNFAPESHPVSLSPYVYWAVGYDDDVFKALVYGHSMRICDHTFQAPPVIGLELGWNINEHHGVGLDAFMKLADYMEGPDLVITDLAFRLSYTYRGGKA